MKKFDFTVVGGGIVGLASAWQLSQRYPGKKIAILEKQNMLACHQTGHNSGVLHSGIYYKPGSLKAENCRLGKKAMEAFCKEEGIDYDICGKVIVAVSEDELPRLQNIYDRGQQNGVQCEIIDAERLKELEPNVAGIRAIHVPEAGIVNYRQVCDRLAEKTINSGNAELILSAEVKGLRKSSGSTVVESTKGELETDFLINCAGLYSDKVTEFSQKSEVMICPFRGEYYELKPEAYHLCRNLIYPVPDPAFPFLGVHFTRMIDGSVECGPNAVLAFAREGYLKTDVNFAELFEILTYGGFIRLAAKYWPMGMGEMWRSISKKAFVKALQRLIPAVQEGDLVTAPAGIRAQAVSPDGKTVDDFLIQHNGHIINVCNAPSPAATASLNIGNYIVDKLAEQM